jgi:hypothetical protein
MLLLECEVKALSYAERFSLRHGMALELALLETSSSGILMGHE